MPRINKNVANRFVKKSLWELKKKKTESTETKTDSSLDSLST